MKNITEIDKNFKIETSIERHGIKFYDPMGNPFEIFGIFKEDGKFRRMPYDVAKSVSVGVEALHTNTAGGRVRFCTDSPYVAIFADVRNAAKLSHFALTASAGFDLYADNRYIKTFVPPYGVEGKYESIIDIADKKMREITINFPLYSDVCELYIGLDENAVIHQAKPYINEKPVVYYGSSITQGGCASRPGMSYQSIISRRLNCDYINLGFSGSAKAEDEMIDYIKNLDMSVFVYDYDHNAPTAEHLENTHEKMFKGIREVHPDIPIIMMSRPKYYLDSDGIKRRAIIEKTYKNAVSNGDKNVYFISGSELVAMCKGEESVDGCHPTDFGFYSMATVLGDLMEKYNII